MKKSRQSFARAPFACDFGKLDYDVDSDEEWEAEPEDAEGRDDPGLDLDPLGR